MKVLCVTHSDRYFVEEKASMNRLATRFPTERLFNLPDFESLPAESEIMPYQGKLSLWKVLEQSKNLIYLGEYKTDAKVQFATFHADFLLVLCSNKLQVLNIDFSLIREISDPWLVGGHTVFVDQEGYAIVTSAPSNSILKIDLELGKVIERILLPEQYGIGYPLTENSDLREHYISTDQQPTHVNCAYPVGDSLLVTFWIPGVVGLLGKQGLFSRSRKYREIVSGFTGCHGGRLKEGSSEIFFADSAAGLILVIDLESGKLLRRLRVDSNWLHDVCPVGNDLLAAGLSDCNEIRLYDQLTGECYRKMDCASFGESVMFVNCIETNELWTEKLNLMSAPKKVQKPSVKKHCGDELLCGITSPTWILSDQSLAEKHLGIVSSHKLRYDYLLKGEKIGLEKGKYYLSGSAHTKKGSISYGLLDVKADQWITEIVFDFKNKDACIAFQLEKSTDCMLIVCAANAKESQYIDIELCTVSINAVKTNSSLEIKELTENIESRSVSNTDSLGKPIERDDIFLGSNLLPGFDDDHWRRVAAKDVEMDIRVSTFSSLEFEYLLEGAILKLKAGDYRLSLEVLIWIGQLTIGILDVAQQTWVAQLQITNSRKNFVDFALTTNTEIKVVIAAANSDGASKLHFNLADISLRPLFKHWVLKDLENARESN